MRWVEDARSWRNPATTMMAHALLVLAWHPNLVVPTVTLHIAVVGVWKYRRRLHALALHPCVRASMAEAPDRKELDEEFDTIPSTRPPEMVLSFGSINKVDYNYASKTTSVLTLTFRRKEAVQRVEMER